MPRTINKEIVPEPKKEVTPKKFVLDIDTTECHWICPCGGKRYKPPEECEYKHTHPGGAGFCVDLVLCLKTCSKSNTCYFYKNRNKGHWEHEKLLGSIESENRSKKSSRTKYN